LCVIEQQYIPIFKLKDPQPDIWVGLSDNHLVKALNLAQGPAPHKAICLICKIHAFSKVPAFVGIKLLSIVVMCSAADSIRAIVVRREMDFNLTTMTHRECVRQG
jgi:hypothetical protein